MTFVSLLIAAFVVMLIVDAIVTRAIARRRPVSFYNAGSSPSSPPKPPGAERRYWPVSPVRDLRRNRGDS